MLRFEDREPTPDGVNVQKSPEVLATLQYVGYLLKDGSRVFMTPKTETKLISPKFLKNGGRWLERAETFLAIGEGTMEHVKSVLNAAWAAKEPRLKAEAKAAEEAEAEKTRKAEKLARFVIIAQRRWCNIMSKVKEAKEMLKMAQAKELEDKRAAEEAWRKAKQEEILLKVALWVAQQQKAVPLVMSLSARRRARI